MSERHPLRAAKLVDTEEDAARTGLPRGAVLTSAEVSLLAPISNDPDYVAIVLYYKRVFDSVVTDVIPPATDAAPRKPAITQIGMFEREIGASQKGSNWPRKLFGPERFWGVRRQKSEPPYPLGSSISLQSEGKANE